MQQSYRIALAGNPNVGKSTVFNALTGLHQHTGNWPGKTVSCAEGCYTYHSAEYRLIDIPGAYSLSAHSAEEESARDLLMFSHPDAVIVVCDATSVERGMNLLLQITELTSRVILCINLMDEAKKKHITIYRELLEDRLGVPVVCTSARSGNGLDHLQQTVESVCLGTCNPQPRRIIYSNAIERELSALIPLIHDHLPDSLSSRFAALRLLEGDSSFLRCSAENGIRFSDSILQQIEKSRLALLEYGLDADSLRDSIVTELYTQSQYICKRSVIGAENSYDPFRRRLDRILTGKYTGIPIMLCLLALVFWLTISASNYPSQLLSNLLFSAETPLLRFFSAIHAPSWLSDALVLGVYRVLAWVVSVMLPPMAIFFPLFTLLEDLGYLPRIAFNLDHCFKRCHACGKQALTMCMGFGCNAVGVTGCRIIDSPRERRIAILTNSLVPCNGRFPTMITILSMFFITSAAGSFSSGLLTALLLTLVILLGIGATFLVSFLLSRTVLKGIPSSFALELPPYRAPQVGKAILRSLLDRTLFVLGRAAAVAAPAGLFIWIMANLSINGTSLLSVCSGALDPFARLIGLDGVLLLAFILGSPANEIVIPIAIMTYLSAGSITELSTAALKTLLLENGWTAMTAVSTVIFSLFHWPCTTTLLTVKKETGSIGCTLAAAVIPTALGILLLLLLNAAARFLGI